MRVHELRDAQGKLVGFEISSLMGRRAACSVAEALPGARMTKRHQPFAAARCEGSFCEFDFNGERYAIEEPFEDNSRYWIGPVQGSGASALVDVLNHFANHKAGTRAVRLGGALAIAALFFAGYSAVAVATDFSKFLQQDRCLDRGGRWNHEDNGCEDARNDD